MRETDEKCCVASQPESPVEHLRRKARHLRDQASRTEKLADKLERLDWNSDLSQAFFESR